MSNSLEFLQGDDWLEWSKPVLTWGNDVYTVTRGKFSIETGGHRASLSYAGSFVISFDNPRHARKVANKIAKYKGWN